MKTGIGHQKKTRVTLFLVLILLLTGWVFVLPNLSPVKTSFIDEVELMTETPYETKAWVNDSGIEGPTIVVIAGIHGNEPAGIATAERLKDVMPSRGKLVLIPRANQPAIAENLRHSPGMQDLNRAFPGKTPGTMTEKAAFAIYQMILHQRPSIVLDLHESFGRIGTHPLALGQSLIVNKPELMAAFVLELIDALNRSTAASDPFTWEYPPLEGTLTAALEEDKIQAVTVETDMGLPITEREAIHLQVIYETMGFLDMRPLDQPDKGVE